MGQATLNTLAKLLSEHSGAAFKMGELLDGASDAALALDSESRIVAWNRTAERLLGYGAREVEGRYCHEVLQAILPGGEPLCGPACPAGLCFSGGQPYTIEACLARHRKGYRVPVCIGSIVNPREGRNPGDVAAILLLRSPDKTPDEVFRAAIPRIFTFGRFGIVLGSKALPVENWARKQALTLLKYLVTHAGNEVHRERLTECLWPGADEACARARLKVIVYFLRRQFRRAGLADDFITTTGKGYALRRGAVWVDAEHFQQLAREGTALQRRQRWDEALHCYQEACILYQGDYLEEEVYADWCAEEREHLRETFLDVLARVARICIQQERFGEAMEVCRAALFREPCRENFHRTLMDCLARSGRRDEALEQYRRCLRTLSLELGVEPMPETQRLYQDIRAQAIPRPGSNP